MLTFLITKRNMTYLLSINASVKFNLNVCHAVSPKFYQHKQRTFFYPLQSSPRDYVLRKDKFINVSVKNL